MMTFSIASQLILSNAVGVPAFADANQGSRRSGLLGAGLSAQQGLEEMPDLVMDDLKAALQYAARRLDHPVLQHDSLD